MIRSLHGKATRSADERNERTSRRTDVVRGVRGNGNARNERTPGEPTLHEETWKRDLTKRNEGSDADPLTVREGDRVSLRTERKISSTIKAGRKPWLVSERNSSSRSANERIKAGRKPRLAYIQLVSVRPSVDRGIQFQSVALAQVRSCPGTTTCC